MPSGSTATAPPAGYVVMVSFDGFRYDYLDRGLTPVLDSLARAGVRADGLIPVMPTKTFPNHYAIATGMYSAEHRLAANTFLDALAHHRHQSRFHPVQAALAAARRLHDHKHVMAISARRAPHAGST